MWKKRKFVQTQNLDNLHMNLAIWQATSSTYKTDLISVYKQCTFGNLKIKISLTIALKQEILKYKY